MKLSTNAAPLLFAITILAAGGLALTEANAAEVRPSEASLVSPSSLARSAGDIRLADAPAHPRLANGQAVR